MTHDVAEIQVSTTVTVATVNKNTGETDEPRHNDQLWATAKNPETAASLRAVKRVISDSQNRCRRVGSSPDESVIG